MKEPIIEELDNNIELYEVLNKFEKFIELCNEKYEYIGLKFKNFEEIEEIVKEDEVKIYINDELIYKFKLLDAENRLYDLFYNFNGGN